jgi:sulfhydrogenase subunit alpha
MNIRIDHVAKMEGHTGFVASILKGDVKSARLEIQDGARLIEGIMVGRHYKDVPVIAQRICGICPVVHNLTSIKAIENAFGIRVSEETIEFRKLLEWAQFIHSHALHLFFLSLADFLDIENDLKLVKKYPEETKKVIKVREFGLKIVDVVGGRVIHPLTNEVGGFKKVPKLEELQKLISEGELVMPVVLEVGEFFKKIKYPYFKRETEYVCLNKKGEYAICEGNIVSNRGLNIPAEKFEKNFHEFQKPMEVIRRVKSEKGTSYMVGAIARINLQYEKLPTEALKFFESLDFHIPDYNPFHNILYQMTELIAGVEESLRILKSLVHKNLDNALSKEFQAKEGSAGAAVEAPRGTLYYHLDIDARGYVKSCNIITPTAQYLSHLEDDSLSFLSGLLKVSDEDKKKKIRALIRAYDPCISCAVH